MKNKKREVLISTVHGVDGEVDDFISPMFEISLSRHISKNNRHLPTPDSSCGPAALPERPSACPPFPTLEVSDFFSASST